MAPSNALMVHMEEKLLPKEKNKLRKPVVEKMRRDRINSSIEQLKLLLEKEFQRHQPNSKLEKADILEVAVSYLKQQSQLQDQKSECRAGIAHLDLLEHPGPRHMRVTAQISTAPCFGHDFNPLHLLFFLFQHSSTRTQSRTLTAGTCGASRKRCTFCPTTSPRRRPRSS
uniref:Transcription factor HES-5 n=1 Tax=Taeniopygia guttata TaxID=59729 RepID=A0A674HHJ7_TAEGU